jgi:hypothetical protein
LQRRARFLWASFRSPLKTNLPETFEPSD